MSNRQLPLSDTDFWWLRYGLGIMLPIALAAWSLYSLVSGHSYAIWSDRHHFLFLYFMPVTGEQAVIMGLAYLGMAVMLFANCYAQYHEKMGYYYQWIMAPGALLAGGGIIWCSLIVLIQEL